MGSVELIPSNLGETAVVAVLFKIRIPFGPRVEPPVRTYTGPPGANDT